MSTLQHLDAAIGELRRQRLGHTAGVGQDDDPRAGRQPHAGRREPVERRPHDGDRHPAREPGVVGLLLDDLAAVRCQRPRRIVAGSPFATDRRRIAGPWGAVADEADDMVEGRVVAQLQRVVAFDPVGLADLGEQLGLLDGVDPQVGFQVEVESSSSGG